MPNPLHDPRYAELRKLLAELRKEQQLTQEELARLLGKPQSYVSKFERGERRLDLIECLDILNVMGISPKLLIDRLQARIVELFNWGRLS